MKKSVKTIAISVVSVVLSILLLTLSVLGIARTNDSATTQVAVRTVSIESTSLTSMEAFETYTISSENDIPTFCGTSQYYDDNGMFFDNMSLSDNKEDYSLKYFCTFDMEALIFHFTMSLVDKNGEIVETETIDSPAFVTENGTLDAYIEIDGETYLMSDLESSVQNDGLFGWIVAAIVVVVVVVVYHVVSETAEQIRCKSNYEFNKKLEEEGNGVANGNYITRQKETSHTGYNAGNYRFGFTTFGGVGCEVASAYNAMIALGKAENLSETIKTFEEKAIEYAAGWGNLGSDPKAMYKFFNDRGISYKKYTNYNNFEKAVSEKSACYIVMSRWNDPWTDGLHTFYIEKNSQWSEAFHSYNFSYRDPNVTVNKNDLVSFNDGDGFIVGYILTK